MNGLCTAYCNYYIDILNQPCQAPLITAEAGRCGFLSITAEKWMISVEERQLVLGGGEL